MKLRETLLFKGLLCACLFSVASSGLAQADVMYDSEASSSKSVRKLSSSVKQKPYLIPDALKNTVFADSVQYKGFYLKGEPTPKINSGVSILVDFEGYGFESQAMKDIANVEEAKKYIDDNLKTYTENGIEVREMKIFYGNTDRVFFWVGDLSFDSLDSAKSFAAAIDKPSLEAQIKQAEETKKQKEKEEEAKSHKLEKAIVKTVSAIKPPLTPEYMSYGDSTWRKTGFEKRGHDFFTGWWEHKFSFKGFEVPGGRSVDFNLLMNVALSSNSTPWENKLTAGVGVEYRPFSDIESWDKLYNSWLTSIRTYAAYLHREPLKDDNGDATRDKRIGFDLYREYNQVENDVIPKTWKQYFWGEAWNDSSFRTTNFGSNPDAFDTWQTAVDIKLGFYLPKGFIEMNIMPYALLNASINDNGDFYSNRAETGLGLRLTPFKSEKYKGYEWLYGLKLFTEYRQTFKYFDDDRPETTPKSDFRIGIGYSHNRY